jgi:hypothetical protein
MSLNFAGVTSQGSLTCRKNLRHGASGFTSHPKGGVLRIVIAIKNPSLRPGLNPRLLGPVASTLTITPPRRLSYPIGKEGPFPGVKRGRSVTLTTHPI